MNSSSGQGGVSIEMPSEDAMIAFYMSWIALGEALRMLGETQGNSGWREELYDRVHRKLENTEASETGDQSLLAKSGVNTSDRAYRNGSKAIDAAFDRIKFA